MKNTVVRVLLVMTIISAGVLCVLLYLAAGKGKSEGAKSRLEEYQEQYENSNTDSRTLAPDIYYDFSKLEDEKMRYDTTRHTEVYERIEALKRNEEYTENAPLVIWNPYGVNTLSLYIYFKTEHPMQMNYRISPQTGEIPTFSAIPAGGAEYQTEHEYLLTGLAAGQSNRVTLTLQDQKGNSCVRTFWVNVEQLFGTAGMKLDVRKSTSTARLSDGLFAHLGNENGQNEAVLLYDNDGVLRGELPILSGGCKRLLFFENRMYYNVSDTEIAAVNRFGRAERVYRLEGYTLGHDYCLDEEQKKLLVLASKSGEGENAKGVNDRVLSVDLISGEVKEVLDMGVLLKEYKEACQPNEEGVLEWLNLNSIQRLEKGILLGAREASAVFKVTDIYGVPVLEYIIGDSVLFAGTGYEGLLLTKEGTFESFFGANAVTCVKEEKMSSNLYTLYLYDNHIGGTESRPELDYSTAGKELGSSLKKGTSSYFRSFLINELEGTWQEQETLELDYSGYAGNAQVMENGNLLTVTAGRFAYNEYDSERKLIRTYISAGKEYLARVYKYGFEGFYFEENQGTAESAEATDRK